jgi:hypothetical protein
MEVARERAMACRSHFGKARRKARRISAICTDREANASRLNGPEAIRTTAAATLSAESPKRTGASDMAPSSRLGHAARSRQPGGLAVCVRKADVRRLAEPVRSVPLFASTNGAEWRDVQGRDDNQRVPIPEKGF